MKSQVMHKLCAMSALIAVLMIVSAVGVQAQLPMLRTVRILELDGSTMTESFGSNMPIPLNSLGGADDVLNGKLFLFGGGNRDEYDGNIRPFSDRIFVYDVQADHWHESANRLPYGLNPQTASHATTPSGKVAISPGQGPYSYNGWGQHNRLIVYNPQTETAQEGASYPQSRIWGCQLVAAADGTVYSFGGWTGSGVSDILRYNESANTLTRVASLAGGGRQVLDATLADNGNIYLFGGNVLSNRIDIFDPSTETCRASSATFPFTVEGQGVHVFYLGGDVIFVMDTYPSQTRIWRYHISTDSFDSSPMPFEFSSQQIYAPFVATDRANNRAYVMGGVGEEPVILATLPFCDDFSGGSRPEWQVEGAHWSFTNGDATSALPTTYLNEWMQVGDSSWTDYVFEVDLMATAGTDKHISFRIQDTDNRYYVHMRGPIQYQDLEIGKVVDGNWNNVIASKTYAVQNNVKYHIKVEVAGTSIKLWINNVLELQAVDNSFPSGGVAIWGHSGGYAPCNVTFDNVCVNPASTSLLAALDIKPGSCPNYVNLKDKDHDDDYDINPDQSDDTENSSGMFKRNHRKFKKLKAAILGRADFDASLIDPTTILLEGVPAMKWELEDEGTPSQSMIDCACGEDEEDGFVDLELKFDLKKVLDAIMPVNPGDIIELALTGELYDGTPIAGNDCIWIIGKEEDDDDDDDCSSPGSSSLALTNSPNPFNPTTTIEFTLPVASNYNMTIYNITGQLVEETSGFSEAGTVYIDWNASDKASGVYFYRLQVGDLVETKKMVLLK